MYTLLLHFCTYLFFLFSCVVSSGLTVDISLIRLWFVSAYPNVYYIWTLQAIEEIRSNHKEPVNFLYLCHHPYSTNRIIKYGLVFPLSLVLVVSLVFSVEYSKGQSITDVSKFSTQPEIGTEEEPTVKDDTEDEETIEDDVPEPTDEEDNETVTNIPLRDLLEQIWG